MNGQIFQPPPPSYSLEGQLPEGTSLVQKDDYVFLCAGSEEIPNGILWVHGNASDCGYEAEALTYLAAELRAFVVAVEYPGYGAAPGKPSVASLTEALSAGFAFLSSRIPAKRCAVVARSLGTGPATALAKKQASRGKPVGALVLWSPMSSVQGIAREVVGVFGFLVSKRWDVEKDIEKVYSPTLFICGGQDTLTPLAMARQLYEKSPASVRIFHVNEQATHNEGWRFEEDVAVPLRAILTEGDFEDSQEEEEKQLWMDSLEVHIDRKEHTQKEKETVPPSRTLSESVSNFKIVIVGAGPVGLFTAVGLVESGVPASSLIVLEKHAAYQRHHVLRLEKKSFAEAPSGLKALVEPLAGTTRTSALETALSSAAEARGIQVVRPCVVSREEVVSAFQQNRILIGCDGSHSVVRENVLSGEGWRESLQSVLDVRLEFKSPSGPPKKLSTLQSLSAFRRVHHVVEESFSKKENERGTYPGTLRLLISPEEHSVMRGVGATLRTPVKIPEQESLLPPMVKKTIRSWLCIRRQHFEDERVESATCSAIDLSVYRAKSFGSRKDGKTTFICGDAAFGVPFFRALNNGLLCVCQLVRCVVDELRDEHKSENVKPETETQHSSSSSTSISSSPLQPNSGTATPPEQAGVFGRFMASMGASTGISRHMADMSAMGASELAKDVFMGGESDPVLRFQEFCRRLSNREFSLAKAKRDALTIVRLANAAAREPKEPEAGSKKRNEDESLDPFEKN
uniref:Uncharacterized protein n=1 Tax=Chromera velia CCMP2878 TaxID=1169474 RepID=A0A0G4HF72_9ALVE|eukprot:Cvel_6624.t1-p1 / transcript=Cvel_6624.t1 / gene=Cvel_6624 / organism=Chromera_velia_CCMP2878 / gene_product=Alpha/beta hydrolase domain-containing protein 13, putative / transcript_product=Alpha/beta hydrolase domain-containing protein 13, putative / location=Cvel_scaffold328:30459-32681(+) / protein_length=741 / sequence_SO=supercontig / SO=protein_coding / is_pseudo=false